MSIKFAFPSQVVLELKPISIEGSKRLIRSAIDYALKNNLKKVTLVHKGNIQNLQKVAFVNGAMKWLRKNIKEEMLLAV